MVFACFYVITTFNCTNMMNLARIMITACRQILLRSYLLQFGLFLWWNICVFAIKKEKRVIHSSIRHYGCSGLPQYFVNTTSIIITIIFMHDLPYSKLLKYHYILALIKEHNDGLSDKTGKQNTISIVIHVSYSKLLIQACLFWYLYHLLLLHHGIGLYHHFHDEDIIAPIERFIGIFTVIKVMKYRVTFYEKTNCRKIPFYAIQNKLQMAIDEINKFKKIHGFHERIKSSDSIVLKTQLCVLMFVNIFYTIFFYPEKK
eukprot:376210_1